MPVKMSRVPVDGIFLDAHDPDSNGSYEFTIDCGALYFGAIYDADGSLTAIDQYFYTDRQSHDELEDAIDGQDLLYIDERDYPVKTYLLTKEEGGQEWLRFHAVVPEEINPDYFYQKYVGE